MNNPFISIIIPAKNAEKTLKKCLDSILNLNYKNFEVIAINDGSRDRTSEILNDYSFKLINTDGVGPSKCRNMAIKQAKGDFTALTDSDCVVDKFWLDELLKGFKEDSIIAVGGKQESPADESEFGKRVQAFISKTGFVTDYGRSSDELREMNHNPSCNVMYRKEAFDNRGFEEGLWPLEDVEFDHRLKLAGYKMIYNPKAIVYHYRPQNLKHFNTMIYRYGLNSGYLFRKYGFFRRSQIVPFILLVFITFALFFRSLIFPGFLLFVLTLLLLFKMVFVLVVISLISWNIGFFKGIFIKNG